MDLSQKGFPVIERRLPKEAPDRLELQRIGELLPLGVRDLVALRGQHWRAQGVDIAALTDDEILDRLQADPLSLRRPILWLDDRVLLGYSADTYRELGVPPA